MPCVQGQDFVLAVAQLQPQGEQGLDQLLEVAALALAARQADHLHAQRTATADDAALLQVEPHGACQRQRVDARVLLETLVLEGDQRAPELLRHLIRRRKTPLPVIGDARAQQRAVARLQHAGQRLLEQRIRQATPDTQRNRQGGERAQGPAPVAPQPGFHFAGTTSTHWPWVRACLVASYMASTVWLGR